MWLGKDDPASFWPSKATAAVGSISFFNAEPQGIIIKGQLQES